jgi:hypothetical protein
MQAYPCKIETKKNRMQASYFQISINRILFDSITTHSLATHFQARERGLHYQ